MTWPWKRRAPLTPAQLAVEELLARLLALPVGQTIILPDRAADGFGGLMAKRHSKYTLVFQRTGFAGRSRWADGPEQAREELQSYVETGKLRAPDVIRGW
jgi:hypothetical protein